MLVTEQTPLNSLRQALVAALALAIAACALAFGAAGASAHSHRSDHKHRSHAARHGLSCPSHARGRICPRGRIADSVLVGIGDEQTEMFSNPLWQRLHTKITRLVVPYDVAAGIHSMSACEASAECAAAAQWIKLASAAHQRILVAFYHSERNPMKMPSAGVYKRDVRAFMHIFKHIHEYQPWNEVNRGTIPHMLKSPSAKQAALYYKALKGSCGHCTVVALDILDQQNVKPTLHYIAQFKHDLRRMHLGMPHLWGLHNYSDTNRFSSSRTRAILGAVPGQVWLTETGGIVKLGKSFPNRKGSGIRRAAKALRYMFGIAAKFHRLKRLYIYDWTGGNSSTRFDAGLMSEAYEPRPGYVVVCQHLDPGHCKVKTVKR